MSQTSSSRNASLVGFGVFLAVFSMGCATHAPVKAPIQTIRVFDAGFERTWAAVVETAAQLVVPVALVSKESGLLTLAGNAPPEWMDCYKPALNRRFRYPEVATLNISVQRISDRQTQVMINSYFQRFHIDRELRECPSTGQVEALFFAGITQSLQTR